MAEEPERSRRSSRDRSSDRKQATRSRSRSRSRSREHKKAKRSRHEKKGKKHTKTKKEKRNRSSSSSSKIARGEKKLRRKRKRRRRDASSSSDSESGSSSGSDSSSGDERTAPSVDLERAAAVVRTLLVEFPAIASDLLALLQMLDDGETAMISGIANVRVKALLATLFPLLGLKKLRKPDGAYVARKGRNASKAASLLETVAQMLASSDGSSADEPDERKKQAEQTPSCEATSQPPLSPGRRRGVAIGPIRPPTLDASTAAVRYPQEEEANDSGADDDGDEDDWIGPALPGMKGFRQADERVEAEMARRAQQLEEDEWRRARGEPSLAAERAAAAAGGREAWMTQMPENNKLFQDAMGGNAQQQRASGKPAAFRSKEPAAIDKTWFDAPEERERGKRAKLDMELLGYVRPENAPAAPRDGDDGPAHRTGPNVNESILPAANPAADHDMRRQMDALRQTRGPSLLEQHQQKIAAEQKQQNKLNHCGGASGELKSSWDRDRDLTARRGLSRDDADRIISASKEISSKFTAPTVTRQFL